MSAPAERSRLARAALRYAAHGWRVFPLRSMDKRPLLQGGRGFQAATTNLPQVRAWWTEHPMANIGLAPGPSGLCVIDIDGPDGEQHAARLGLAGLPTLTVFTGRADGGRHLYFARPRFTVGNTSAAPHVDVRCDAGYVVLPPSVHPTGTRYRFADPAVPIASLPRQALDALRSAQAHPCDHPPSRDSAALVAVGTALDGRIAAYLRAIGARSEGERNKTAFRVAAALVRDFALADGVAWSWLVGWNATNSPPLSKRELRSVLRSARQHGRHAVGAALRERSCSFRARGHLGRHFGTPFGAGR